MELTEERRSWNQNFRGSSVDIFWNNPIVYKNQNWLYISFLDGKFPIDTASVIKEHHFLDQDSIQSLYRLVTSFKTVQCLWFPQRNARQDHVLLFQSIDIFHLFCRRLQTLNRCAKMNLHIKVLNNSHFLSYSSLKTWYNVFCRIIILYLSFLHLNLTTQHFQSTVIGQLITCTHQYCQGIFNLHSQLTKSSTGITDFLILLFEQSDGYDSDEEDLIALSSRWKLQNKNRRWSSRRNGSPSLSKGKTPGLSSSHNGINSSLNSVTNTRQRSFHKKDRLVPDQLSPFSHLDLCITQGRASVYDNLSPALSVSTPSISNVGKDLNKNDELKHSNRTQKRNLTSSDLGLESYSASSNEELSDLERDDEIDDLPGDLSMLRSIRNSERQCNNDMAPSSTVTRPKVRWHSFEKTSKPDIRVM